MRTLRSRLALLVLVALAPGFAMLWSGSRSERAALLLAAEADAAALARRIADQQARTVHAARGLLSAFAEASAVTSGDREGCRRIAAGLLARTPELSNVGAATLAGEVYCTAIPASRPVAVSDQPFFLGALQARAFAPGGVAVSRLPAIPALDFGQPVLGRDGEPAGVVFAGVAASHVARQLEALALPAGVAAYVTDAAGVVLAGTGVAPGEALPAALRPPAAAGAARVLELDGPDGVRRFYGFEAIGEPGGPPMLRVVAGLPSALAYEAADQAFRRSLLGHGLSALLVLAAVGVAGHLLVTRRVDAIVGAARRLSRGDYSVRTGLAGRGDVGELARTFDEMAASLERLTRRHRLVLESAGDGILEVDRERRITFANPAAERLFGVPPGQALGRPVHDYIPDRSRRGCAACLAIDEGNPRHDADTKLVREDGTTVPAECTAAPVVDGGAIVGAVVTVKDVREQRRLEEDLRQAQKMEAVGQLAGGIAHDFNNVLTAILGAAQFARGELHGHAAEGDVDDILKAAKRGADLTRRLLSFSRRQVAELRVTEVRTVVSAVQELLKRLLPERISLGTRVAPERCLVRVDRGLLEQALVNLALNARDAMPRGGRLVIEARPIAPDAPERADDPGLPEGRLVLVSVKDTGVGMDEATRSHIFEPFFTTKEAGKGTGLGLSTVYSAVNAAGGAVRVDSAPGAGTTFRLYLPRVLDDIAPTPPPPRRPRAGSERVLLVEDDATIRALSRRALEAGGYQVLEGDRPSAGLRALELSGSTRLDLLVTDVMLPESNGGELADALSARFPGLRVLFVSGYTGGQLDAAATEAPGRAFLAKPFGPDALVARVRELLDTPLPD